ncbi:hypothetical protein Cal7507_1682 [Calothrix sp. PCC 7507]|nr:hypothetical protein Cal7507_1682 [Calothrix sp. PCC 7507]
MVKPINYNIKANKTCYGASLQVMLLTHNFGHRVPLSVSKCIHSHQKIPWRANSESSNNFLLQYYCLFQSVKNYNKSIATLSVNKEKKINTVSCKIGDQFKFLIGIGGQHCQLQRNTKQNQQHRSEDINCYWKLYRPILSKYRYTSLELVVRSPALTAGYIANFRTCNPVRVANSENNKEHCHNFRQCQTIVDS